jgi:threonine/homoserine/homoserine lactone efflux protein
LKTFGAVYLIYLAYKAIRHRNDPIDAHAESQKTEAEHRTLILRGFYMNVLNPKVALFFLAFLPQFVNTAYSISVPGQMIILGLIFMAQVAVIFGFIGYFAGSLGNWLLKRPNFTKAMNMVSAAIFLGLGIKLLTSTR